MGRYIFRYNAPNFLLDGKESAKNEGSMNMIPSIIPHLHLITMHATAPEVCILNRRLHFIAFSPLLTVAGFLKWN
jgi:hypothetical protein